MEAIARHRFNTPHELEGATIEFRQSAHLLRLVVRATCADPQFQNFYLGHLRVASATLDRAWGALEAKIVTGAPVTGGDDDVVAVEEAVRLVDFVVTDDFGAAFEKRFPAESDAIHCAAAVVWDSWRNLAAGIASLAE